MKEMNHTQSVAFPDVQRDKNIGGLPVLRDLKGPICAHCGSLRYFLVFRVSGDGRNGILAGRCSRCRNPESWQQVKSNGDAMPELKNHGQEQ